MYKLICEIRYATKENKEPSPWFIKVVEVCWEAPGMEDISECPEFMEIARQDMIEDGLFKPGIYEIKEVSLMYDCQEDMSVWKKWQREYLVKKARKSNKVVRVDPF